VMVVLFRVVRCLYTTSLELASYSTRTDCSIAMALFVLSSTPPLEQLVVVSFLRLRRLPRRLLERGTCCFVEAQRAMLLQSICARNAALPAPRRIINTEAARMVANIAAKAAAKIAALHQRCILTSFPTVANSTLSATRIALQT
jgi:hypothetical protein